MGCYEGFPLVALRKIKGIERKTLIIAVKRDLLKSLLTAKLRRQRHCVLWEHAVAQSGVPQYLGSPDDLKLLLMKAVNRKTRGHGYRVQNGSRLSFHGRWYVCPGLLFRLAGREFDLYCDRRDVRVLYIFVEGEY